MILSEEDRRELAKNFPGRCVSHYWLLAFSTLHHGFSLKSLYRNCQDHDGPSLLVIQSKDQVRVNKIKTEPHQLNNFQFSGNLRGILVRRAESEREILRHGRVLAVLLLLRRDEDLQLAGGQQLHPQGQPQLPHHRVRYDEDSLIKCVETLFLSQRSRWLWSLDRRRAASRPLSACSNIQESKSVLRKGFSHQQS